MPCRCDGYENDSLNRISDANTRLHKELCRARAIIMKMLKNDELADCSNHPEDLLTKAENEVKLLLKHKKEEIKSDIDKLDMKRRELAQKERKIRELGGEPRAELLSDIKKVESEIDNLANLTDEEILGT